MAKSQKKKTWEWCSRYIRIRDAIEWNLTLPENQRNFMWGQCCTCRTIVNIKKKGGGQAGHFKSRGIGGSSGIYFDERAINLQCAQCNAFNQGSPDEYREFLENKYGSEIIEELKLLNKIHIYRKKDLVGLELYFKQKTEEMCREYKIDKWW